MTILETDLRCVHCGHLWTSVDSVPVFVWQNPGVGGRRWLLHLQHFSSSKGRFGHLMTFEHFELCCVGLCRRYSACVNRTLHIPYKSSKANSEFYFRQFFSDHLKCGFTLLINLFSLPVYAGPSSDPVVGKAAILRFARCR